MRLSAYCASLLFGFVCSTKVKFINLMRVCLAREKICCCNNRDIISSKNHNCRSKLPSQHRNRRLLTLIMSRFIFCSHSSPIYACMRINYIYKRGNRSMMDQNCAISSPIASQTTKSLSFSTSSPHFNNFIHAGTSFGVDIKNITFGDEVFHALEK